MKAERRKKARRVQRFVGVTDGTVWNRAFLMTLFLHYTKTHRVKVKAEKQQSQLMESGSSAAIRKAEEFQQRRDRRFSCVFVECGGIECVVV